MTGGPFGVRPTLRWRGQSRANPSLVQNSLLAWEKAGNFVDSGVKGAVKDRQKERQVSVLPTNSRRIRAGNFLQPCRELDRASKEISTLIRESRSRALFGGLAPADKPDFPDSSRTFPGRRQRGARCSKSPQPISSSRPAFIHVKGCAGHAAKSLAELPGLTRVLSVALRAAKCGEPTVARDPGFDPVC
jgi:hypothetical protein